MFKKFTRSTLTALGLLPLAFFSEDLRAEQSSEVLRSSRLVAELQVSKKMGGNVDLLVPLYGDASQFWYGNLQGYQYGSTYRTFGLGAGHRQIMDNAIYGFYGFFDRQTSVNKINYNRYNIGLERLGETWDFRTNFYYYASSDVTNLVDRGQQSALILGNSILYAHLYDVEKVYNGADVEVGRTLGLDNLRGYLGYYNFGDVIKGPKARIEYQVNPRVALSASTQTDVRGWLTYAGVSYWFGKTTLPDATGIATRMLDPVVRDMTVAANVVNNYVDYDVDPRSIYFAQPSTLDNAGPTLGGTGTETSPYSLQEAIAASKDNDIIYLLGSDQPFDITDGITLKPGQMLWSNTQNLSLNNFLVKAGDPTKAVNLINGGITVTNGATLSGFKLDGTSESIAKTGSGITINGTSAVNISNLNVTGFAYNSHSAGIEVLGAANVTLTDVIVDRNGTGLSATAGTITIDGTSNSFQNNTQGAGIYIAQDAQLRALKNVTVSDNSKDGINLSGTGTYNSTFTSVSSNDNGGIGLIINNANVTLTATDLIANTNDNGGLNVSAGQVGIYGTNNFSNNTGAGVYVEADGQLSYLENATLSGNTGNGLAFVGRGNYAATLAEITTNNNGKDGILLAGSGEYTATLSTATSNYNSGNGIKVDNSKASVQMSNIISNSNSGGSGLWINEGTVSDAGSTKNEFKSNSQYGVLVGAGSTALTSSGGRLLSLTNADTSNNGKDSARSGLVLNSSNTTDTVTLDNITSSSNGNHGIWILQAGTVNITTKATTSSNTGSGVRVENSGAIVTINNATSELNTSYGLRLVHGHITVNGSNIFSRNKISGIFANNSDSTLILNNATIESNLSNGISLTDTGATTISSSTISGNTSFAMQVDNVHSVSLLNTTINSSSDVSALFVVGGSTVNISDASSIAYTGTADKYAIQVTEDSHVIINDDHLTLQGDIANAGETGDRSKIEITVQGVTNIYDTVGQRVQCDYTDGSGTCTPVP